MRAEQFEVGPHVGIAMAITAPRRTFERVFGTVVEDAADGGWMAGDRGSCHSGSSRRSSRSESGR